MKAFIYMHLRSSIKVALSGRKSTLSASWGLKMSLQEMLCPFSLPCGFPASLDGRFVCLFLVLFWGGLLLLLFF